MPRTPAPVTPAYLVVGPLATADDVDNLRGYAFDVAEQMGAPAVYATHNEYTVTDFAAVYTLGSVTDLRDAPTLVLVAEALGAGMEVYEQQSPQDTARCVCGQLQTVRTVVDERGEVWCAECRAETACAWCMEYNDTEDLEILARGETWIPVHAGCVRGFLPARV